jgi:hypothetical protein
MITVSPHRASLSSLTYPSLNQVLESTSVLKEVGAALSIGAGGNMILRRLGVHLEQEGGIIPDSIAVWTMDGNKIAEHPPPACTQYGDHIVSDWRQTLTWRIDLNTQLRYPFIAPIYTLPYCELRRNQTGLAIRAECF